MYNLTGEMRSVLSFFQLGIAPERRYFFNFLSRETAKIVKIQFVYLGESPIFAHDYESLNFVLLNPGMD
jgi:hypothetical protein